MIAGDGPITEASFRKDEARLLNLWLARTGTRGHYAGVAPFAPRAKQARMVADNPPQAGRPARGKEKGAAPAGWGSQGPQLAERKRVARRSRAGSRASQ